MPLNKSNLEKALRVAFSTPSDNFRDPANRIAKAYTDYAKTATSCAGGSPIPASITAAGKILQKVLEATYMTSRDPVSTISKKAAAFAAFWLTPPVAFTGATPGAVTVAVPATLQAVLLAITASNAARAAAGSAVDAHRTAAQWAKALDLWTKTVVVVHAPPSACASPIT